MPRRNKNSGSWCLGCSGKGTKTGRPNQECGLCHGSGRMDF